MSNLSFMEKLLEGVEVKWTDLGAVSEIYDGTHQTPKYTDTGIPFVSVQNIKNLYGTEKFISAEDFEKYKYKPRKNDLFMTRIGDVGTCAVVENDEPLAYYVTLALIRVSQETVLPKFIKYFIESGFGKVELYKRTLIHAVPMKINLGEIGKIVIPIPCPENPKKSLGIQAEIVRILDAFTAHTAELTAELTARKKQYNYYRDKLLSFEEGDVEWKTLPEMALDFGRGKSKHRPRNDEKLYGGDIPFIQTGDIRNASHIIMQYSQTYSELGLRQSKLWPKGALCITIAANIAETSILGFDACFPDSVIGFVADPKKTSAGYVEYLLQSIKNKLEEKGKEKSSAQSNINLATFEQLKLPFPSIAEQARIVAILDQFDTLISSITEGLPREIELRQKQYEHYRDLLLSFPKLEEVAA